MIKEDDFFCPPTWTGEVKDFQRFDVYPWMENLTKYKKIFCNFWVKWQNSIDLPLGYDFYIISYHIENINEPWLRQQRQRVSGKIIVLHPGYIYDFQINGIDFITYLDWHEHTKTKMKWHGVQDNRDNKIYKYSAVCNRVTQSKVWVTTKLLETAREQSLIYINHWIEGKNVHHWQLTGNAVLDDLTQTYQKKYLGLKISDGFTAQDNKQRYNSNPWQPLYMDAALHFTNGSFHYSLMSDPQGNSHIYPGPDIDEKTLKCLVAGTPFIACGQFEIYKILSDFGLEFDYEFDLSWDNDPGNMSRFHSICRLIDDLNALTIDDIVQLTKKSTQHNKEFIIKGGFYSRLEQQKKQSINQLMDLIHA